MRFILVCACGSYDFDCLWSGRGDAVYEYKCNECEKVFEVEDTQDYTIVADNEGAQGN